MHRTLVPRVFRSPTKLDFHDFRKTKTLVTVSLSCSFGCFILFSLFDLYDAYVPGFSWVGAEWCWRYLCHTDAKAKGVPMIWRNDTGTCSYSDVTWRQWRWYSRQYSVSLKEGRLGSRSYWQPRIGFSLSRKTWQLALFSLLCFAGRTSWSIEMSPLSRDNPAVKTIQGQLSTSGRSLRTHTSEFFTKCLNQAVGHQWLGIRVTVVLTVQFIFFPHNNGSCWMKICAKQLWRRVLLNS